MQTFDEQKAFFDEHWAGMKQAVETGGAEGVLTWMSGFEDPLQRRVLALFARQGLALGRWEGKDLLVYADVIQASVERLLEEGAASTEAEKARRSKELANVILYNLSADLADCWPAPEASQAPEAPEAARRFEAGLLAARRCVAWREELEKGPAALSMALWAQGMHEFSLGRDDAAVQSFASSLDTAKEAAAGEPSFGVNLGEGYLGLAKWRRGDADGEAVYAAAIRSFEDQLGDEDQKDDAQFGIEQLETVRKRYLRGK